MSEPTPEQTVDPYRPPDDTVVPELTGRQRAQRSVGRALLAFYPPVVVNALANLGPADWLLTWISLLVAGGFFGFLFLVARFSLLWVLEVLARLARTAFAPQVPEAEWDGILYRGLRRLVPMAVLGALVYFLWMLCIFVLQVPLGLASIAAQVVGHSLGAAVYVPILYAFVRRARVDRPALS